MARPQNILPLSEALNKQHPQVCVQVCLGLLVLGIFSWNIGNAHQSFAWVDVCVCRRQQSLLAAVWVESWVYWYWFIGIGYIALDILGMHISVLRGCMCV